MPWINQKIPGNTITLQKVMKLIKKIIANYFTDEMKRWIEYRKNSNKRPAYLKHPHPISPREKFKSWISTRSFWATVPNKRLPARVALIQNIWCYSRALVGYLKVIWYFLKTFLILKKINAKVTCLLHKPACKKKKSHSLIFKKSIIQYAPR